MRNEKWVAIKPKDAPYYGIHTATGETIAGTCSGLSERDAQEICALHNHELSEADDLKARFLVESPDEIQATMKITMTVKEWTELRDQLQNRWPSCRLSIAINSVVSEARKVYYAPEKDAFT